MIDLKILSIQDLLPVTRAEYAQGIVPLSLLVTGEKLNEASYILINDVRAPEFIILSANRLLVQVPDSEKQSPLSKIAVISEAPSITRSSVLSFQLGSSIKPLQGIERMVQLFVKLLMQTPGSDKFDPTKGGGLMSAVGKNISRADGKSVQAAVVNSVSRTRDQVLSMQSKNNRLPADERLLTAKTEAIGYDPNTTTVSARVAIAAVSGRQAVTNLSF